MIPIIMMVLFGRSGEPCTFVRKVRTFHGRIDLSECEVLSSDLDDC